MDSYRSRGKVKKYNSSRGISVVNPFNFVNVTTEVSFHLQCGPKLNFTLVPLPENARATHETLL